MTPIVAVLGADAMGCLFGGELAEHGLDVTLVDVWREHVDAINRDGLRVVGHRGARRISVPATGPRRSRPCSAHTAWRTWPAPTSATTCGRS